VALVAAFAIAAVTTPAVTTPAVTTPAVTTPAVTTPAGVSGAVLLLPFQVSVLGTPSPSVTPTNLLYNVVASPGRDLAVLAAGPDRRTLTWLLPAGTLPGVIAGSVIRVYVAIGIRFLWAGLAATL
jgi:hypothetical protein